MSRQESTWPTAGREIKSLGECVCELLPVDSNQAYVSVLDRFMGEGLPNVNVLGTLSASDDVVTPLNASIVVLVQQIPFGAASVEHLFYFVHALETLFMLLIFSCFMRFRIAAWSSRHNLLSFTG